MANSFLQGMEVGGGLVGRALQAEQQNALLPLQVQEARDKLHMNALNLEEAQYHRDIEIQTKEGNTAVAAWAAKPHDWASDQTMADFVALTQTHPMALKSPAGQLAQENMKAARAAKNTLDRTIEIQNLIADRMAERDQARAERDAAKAEATRIQREADAQQKLLQIKATTDAAMARQMARIEAPGKMATHADLAIFKSKVEALIKSPEFSTWTPAKQQRTIDALGDELKSKMKAAPKEEATTDASESLTPETSPAMATPPAFRKVKNKDGKVGTVPAAQYEQALKEGYLPAD